MRLQSPFAISSRLMPGLLIGGAWIQLEYSKRPGDNGRTRYQYWIDLPDGSEHSGDDLQSGCGRSAGLQEMFATLLAFLSACGESYSYAQRTGCDLEDTNAGEMFPLAVAEWAAQYSDELSMMQIDLEESGETYITE